MPETRKPVVYVRRQPGREGYAAELEQIAENGVCPFCPELLPVQHVKPVLHRGKHWIITDSDHPYGNSENCIMFISIAHIEDIFDLPDEAHLELLQLERMMRTERGMEGGTMIRRAGNPVCTAGSVYHLHAILVNGSMDTENHADVVVAVG